MMSIYEKKNYGRSTAYKAEAVFPIMYFKAEAVIGKRFSNIIVLRCSFFTLFKAWRNACDKFHFSSLFIISCSLLFYWRMNSLSYILLGIWSQVLKTILSNTFQCWSPFPWNDEIKYLFCMNKGGSPFSKCESCEWREPNVLFT